MGESFDAVVPAAPTRLQFARTIASRDGERSRVPLAPFGPLALALELERVDFLVFEPAWAAASGQLRARLVAASVPAFVPLEHERVAVSVPADAAVFVSASSGRPVARLVSAVPRLYGVFARSFSRAPASVISVRSKL